MIRNVLLLYMCLCAGSAGAASFEDDFAVVFIDAETERRLGPIPLDRAVLAEGIEKLADAGAKGVVLKFFIDLPKDSASDQRLAAALQRIPTVLQAIIANDEPAPNALPDRFFVDVEATTTIAGQKGWIPLPLFADHAADIGFVDFNGFPAPLLETYQGRTVKSLFLCAIELAVGERARIVPGVMTVVGNLRFALTERNEMTLEAVNDATIQYLPFHTLIDGSADLAAVRNKVVVLGYEGPNIQKVATPAGAIGAHKLLVLLLKDLYESGVPLVDGEPQ